MKHVSQILILLTFCLHLVVGAQTPGLIVKPSVAGKAVLDGNNDGYVSLDPYGFVTSDETESEIPFVRMVLPSAEPTGDLAQGPNCGFVDLVDDPSNYSSVYTYLDGSNNLLFRFRLGNYAQNSKGYSILIDSDSKFGSSGNNADPNYVEGNPGFEIEIELVTNQGIRLYAVDGAASGTLKTTLSYDDYCQKSIALSTNCGDADYFYDFYIPFSEITTYFPTVTTSTPLRMVANTVISTQSAIAAGPTDVAGVDDGSFGNNTELIWTEIIDAYVPTATTAINSGLPPVRSDEPSVSGPIAGGATSVSGSSTEADGTVIEVFVDGVSVGNTTVTVGSWTLTGLTLTSGEVITATASALGESVSLISNAVVVGSTCTTVPTTSCNSAKGIGGETTSAGATIRVYGPDDPAVLLATETSKIDNTYLYNCAGGTTNCTGGGPNCIVDGVYWVTSEEVSLGKCESAMDTYVCIGTSGSSTAPVISTSPVLESTTSLSGTGPVGSSILLYIDGYHQATTTESGGWTFNGLNLSLGEVINVFSIVSGKCISTAASVTVTGVTSAPEVSGPIVSGSTSVSGTSSEPVGTNIEVFVNGSSVGTTTVDAYGNWTLSGLTALNSGDNVKATATATDKTTSTDSNIVTVLTTSSAPVVTGTYSEGDTQVTGTSATADGTVINVYIDGVLIGTTTVSGNNWSLSGIDANELYPGGAITARAIEIGKAESSDSNSEIVSCTNPSIGLTVNVVTNGICFNDSATIEVLSSEFGVIYTLRNATNTADKGPSVLGTGGNINLGSVRVTSNETFKVKAVKIPSISCNGVLTDDASVTVTYPPDLSGVNSGDYFWTGSTVNLYWDNKYNWVQYDGANYNTVAVPPATTDNVIIKPTQACVTSQPTVKTSSGDALAAVCNNLTIDVGGALVLQNSGDERMITVRGNWVNNGSFTANSGTIKFNGGGLQTISNSTGAETFSSVIIEGTSTTVTPNCNVECNSNGVLNLNQGILDLNSKKWTVNNSSNTAIVRTSPGYIKSESQNASGEIRWNIGANSGINYIFPMGSTAGNFIPVTMKLTSGDIGIAGVATVNSDPSLAASWPNGSEAIGYVENPTQVINRFWHLDSDQAPSSYNVSVTFTYLAAEDPSIGVLNTAVDGMIMKRWSGTNWQSDLPGQTYTHANRTISVPGIDRFSWWGGGNKGQAALPIELTNFNASRIQNAVELTWETEVEINNDFFEIQKSYDGENFISISTMKGYGNSNSGRTYIFIDKEGVDKMAFYRLKQVDFDGAFTHSQVVSVKPVRVQAKQVSVYPNPVSEKLFIDVADVVTISALLYNSLGTMVRSVKNQSTSKFYIELQGLPKGLYYLEVMEGTQMLAEQKIMIID